MVKLSIIIGTRPEIIKLSPLIRMANKRTTNVIFTSQHYDYEMGLKFFNELHLRKPDYKLFFVAIAFNVITYVAIQIQIASNMRVEGDSLTGFLFNIFAADFASTVIFALYFVFILGLYFLAKVKEMKIYIAKTSSRKKSKSKLRLILGKDLNPMLAVASFLWLLFIILSLFHLLAMGNDLMTIFT